MFSWYRCDRPGEGDSVENCCLRLTFRQSERKSSAKVVETSVITTVFLRTTRFKPFTLPRLLFLFYGKVH